MTLAHTSRAASSPERALRHVSTMARSPALAASESRAWMSEMRFLFVFLFFQEAAVRRRLILDYTSAVRTAQGPDVDYFRHSGLSYVRASHRVRIVHTNTLGVRGPGTAPDV
jgi:hypothetical protein